MRLSCRRRLCEGREYSLRSSQCDQSIHRPLVNLTSPHPYLFWHRTPLVNVVKPKSTNKSTNRVPLGWIHCPRNSTIGLYGTGELNLYNRCNPNPNPLRVLPIVTGFWCKCCFPACCVCPETRHNAGLFGPNHFLPFVRLKDANGKI